MDKENIIKLRNHLRLVWQSYATASLLINDTLNPTKAFYLKRQNPMMHRSGSSAYLYLMASNNFLRSVDKIVDYLESEGLKNIRENIKREYPDLKNSRDILEHFEDYALGNGKLQKQGVELLGNQINVMVEADGATKIQVFNLGEIEKSKLDWNIDGLAHFLEKSIHEKIYPEKEWPGWLPDKF